MKKDNFLQVYYFVTPIFFIFEYFFGFNIRVKLPADFAFLNYIYYIICFLGAFLFFKYKVGAAIFSLVECSINIFTLLLSVMLPVFMLGSMDTTEIIFGKIEIIHFLIAGIFLIISFRENPLINRQ